MSDETIPDISHAMFPLREFLGFSVESGEGSGVVTLDLDDRHMNPNNMAHGAVAFAMMDTAMGSAVVSLLNQDQMCATVEMHTRFHRPAASGLLTATATVLTAGRRMAHLEAKTHDDQGRLVASATSSFAIVSG